MTCIIQRDFIPSPTIDSGDGVFMRTYFNPMRKSFLSLTCKPVTLASRFFIPYNNSHIILLKHVVPVNRLNFKDVQFQQIMPLNIIVLVQVIDL